VGAQEEQKRDEERLEKRTAQSSHYRLAAWVKTRCGSQFRSGVKSVDIETQLEELS